MRPQEKTVQSLLMGRQQSAYQNDTIDATSYLSAFEIASGTLVFILPHVDGRFVMFADDDISAHHQILAMGNKFGEVH